MTVKREKDEALLYYRDNREYLSDELAKLDLLIQRRVVTFRQWIQAIQAAGDQKRYISHGEVDWLLSREGLPQIETPEFQMAQKQLEEHQDAMADKVRASLERGIFLALPQLARLFALSRFELQIIVICLAPELKRKYDKLYAYLQDDVTRKKPSIDLVLDLLCLNQTERWQARALFADHAPLLKAGIVHLTDDRQSPSGSSDLSRFLKLDRRILSYLAGDGSIDGRLNGLVTFFAQARSLKSASVDSAIKRDVINLIEHHLDAQDVDRKKLVLYFHGPYGVGRQNLALGICERLRCPMLSIDTALLLKRESDFGNALRLIFREGLLSQAALYFDGADLLMQENDRALVLLKTLATLTLEYGWLVFLAGERPWLPRGVFERAVFHAVELPVPDVPLRESAWREALGGLTYGVDTAWSGTLARQFKLTPGQIGDAASLAKNRCAMRDGQKSITLADLYSACRSQSHEKLGELAVKTDPRYCWSDIVLPNERKTQLKEICSQIKHGHRVFGEWGFGRKLSRGKGLSVLFFGLPGTGKTMAAEIMANELALDLYKIDLSGVVSKYIGETEKNLARIFHEAESANAILFFDEADALFGKRTQVSDAHDRYANVETSYLLQKMEEYEGMVILATNLRENMDEAFTRRIRFTVEFPFPNAVSRMEIWKTHFPHEAPLSKAIDYTFLSKRFQIAGGNIKNIVLNAAFLAAENGGAIGMEHIIHGARREFEKMGKLWDERFQNPYGQEIERA
jgi:AAA+ superfamily predicted ATPase